MLKSDLPIFGTDPRHALRVFSNTARGYLYSGDFQALAQYIPDGSIDAVITSPPYYIGKEYDLSKSVDDYIRMTNNFIEIFLPKVRLGGSIAWQVGNHIGESNFTPLDIVSYNVFGAVPDV